MLSGRSSAAVTNGWPLSIVGKPAVISTWESHARRKSGRPLWESLLLDGFYMRHGGFVGSMFVWCSPIRNEVLSRILGAFRVRGSTNLNCAIYASC